MIMNNQKQSIIIVAAVFIIVGAVFLVLATFLASSYTVHKDSRGFLYSSLIGAAANIILNIILLSQGFSVTSVSIVLKEKTALHTDICKAVPIGKIFSFM